MSVKLERITRNVEIKRQFTDEEKIALLKQIADADLIITQKTLELKDITADYKEQIEEQRDIISSCSAKARQGFEIKNVECSAIYKDGEATFIDKEGVIVESRPMTEEEQLMLSNGRISAEDIIRESSRQEDED